MASRVNKSQGTAFICIGDGPRDQPNRHLQACMSAGVGSSAMGSPIPMDSFVFLQVSVEILMSAKGEKINFVFVVGV